MNPGRDIKHNSQHSSYRDEPSMKKKLTDKFCNLLNYISLLLSFVYNIYFFSLLKNDLLTIPEYEGVKNNHYSNICNEMSMIAGYIISWNIISISKAFILLFLCRACFGDDNDCNWFCLLVKALSSFIPSIIFCLKLRKFVDFNDNNDVNQYCHNLNLHINKFFDWELYYIMGIISCICLIPAGALLVGMKEFYKSRKKDY